MTSALQAGHDIRPLSESDAEVYVASVCFKTGPPGAAGVEVERLVHDAADPQAPVTVARVRQAMAASAGALPGGGVITFEPGGQLEVSSACAPGLPALVAATRKDLEAVETRLSDAGLFFGSVALLPYKIVVTPPCSCVYPPGECLPGCRFNRCENFFGPAPDFKGLFNHGSLSVKRDCR